MRPRRRRVPRLSKPVPRLCASSTKLTSSIPRQMRASPRHMSDIALSAKTGEGVSELVLADSLMALNCADRRAFGAEWTRSILLMTRNGTGRSRNGRGTLLPARSHRSSTARDRRPRLAEKRPPDPLRLDRTLCSSIPTVSVTMTGDPRRSRWTSMTSRVVPASSDTMATSRRASARQLATFWAVQAVATRETIAQPFAASGRRDDA